MKVHINKVLLIHVFRNLILCFVVALFIVKVIAAVI